MLYLLAEAGKVVEDKMKTNKKTKLTLIKLIKMDDGGDTEKKDKAIVEHGDLIGKNGLNLLGVLQS